MFRCRHSNWTLGTLIPGKPHSRVKSRNSRVSIETLDFALRTFTCVIEAGLLAGASDDAGQSVNVAGEWAHETAGSGRVSGAMAHVETHAGKAMGECDHQPDARLRETTGPPSHRRPDDQQTLRRSAHLMSALTWLWTVIFLVSYIQADWSHRICTAGPIQWRN